MSNRLQISDLDFETIKTNLKNFLRTQSEFQDYDFEGSGLNILLDILAYNTHYNSYYLNMVANESFLDTSIIRDSVISHAKLLGYTPRSINSSKSVINLNVTSPNDEQEFLTLPRGFNFKSDLLDGTSYNFTILDDVTIEKTNSEYYFENLEIYEGEILNYNFTYNEQINPKSIFTLPNENIDTKTIKVQVIESSTNTSSEVFIYENDILKIDGDSNVFFIQEGRNGIYEIYFGNGVIGKKLKDGNVVNVSYLVTNGDEANKINGFIVSSPIERSFISVEIEVVNFSFGGAPKESIPEIKKNAPSYYTTQDRLVTVNDYETYIKNKYPNIDSISVWGGEENTPPIYGKIFISLKPKTGYFISELEKQKIINEIVSPKSILSITTEIRDPELLYVLLDTNVQYNAQKTILTKESLKGIIRETIIDYNNIYLNKFSSKFVISKLQESIDEVDLNSIVGSETRIKVQKRFEPILNQKASYMINFSLPLKRGTTFDRLTSTEFNVRDSTNILRTVTLEEVPQSFTGISEILVTNPGFNYVTAPTVTITGDGSGAEAVANIVNGKLQSVTITKRGFDYSRAVIRISGGGGLDAEATAVIDSKVGTLRLVYFDTNAERRIVNSNVGTINYDTGLIRLIDVNVESLPLNDEIRITCESELGIIQSVRNTILSIDEDDPSSIIINLEQI